ncbi:MAG: class I SAM-dependent methyltransferase [Synechococcus sp. Tobar2m-G35]|jgi:ubiquinone/menaquinone biosynthesis C-methylase UbiE|nr:class I SAM-dependent methyltransferase [Synechococcus sp. Tobar2m-G35]
MAGGPLRRLAYRHRWIYDSVTAVSSLPLGGPARLRRLAADWLLAALPPGARVLDLCCGSGEAAAPLLAAGAQVTGLDIAPRALELAGRRHPTLTLVQGLAEDPPLAPASFDGIQLSLALHEFPDQERRQLLRAARRLVSPGGRLALVDLHAAGPLMHLPQQLFCSLFETETATAFLALDLGQELQSCGWRPLRHELLAGGALQRWLAEPLPPP